MNDIFGKIVSIFLACGIFFRLPLVYMNERANTAEQLYLLTETTHFVDSVCNVGKIDEQMLQRFYDSIARDNVVYEIKVLHETGDYAYDTGKDSYERVSRYYDEEDIWNALRQGQDYYFYRGDFLRVTILRVSGYALFPQNDQTLNIQYGGTVKYEAF